MPIQWVGVFMFPIKFYKNSTKFCYPMLLLLLDFGAAVIIDVQVLTSRLTAPPLPAYSTLRNNSPTTMPRMLGKILSWIIYLIFNYQPGLVALELLQNICDGRECHGNI